mmetsp:Transcript_8605/g.28359  ORF Transcript_8605/g.28359 Transcript_8605/m.28359 type:complete len:95 (-) Transcript_8605:984-1268(-)|eukprot:scaffold637_cov118-Isochrysis_galbana.AAC.15
MLGVIGGGSSGGGGGNARFEEARPMLSTSEEADEAEARSELHRRPVADAAGWNPDGSTADENSSGTVSSIELCLLEGARWLAGAAVPAAGGAAG